MPMICKYTSLLTEKIVQMLHLIWLAERLPFTTGCCTTLLRSTQISPRQPCSVQCKGYNCSRTWCLSQLLERQSCSRISSRVSAFRVIFDTHHSFDQYVGEVCKRCYYHIYCLCHVRALMSVNTANMVACAIVGARLDYCNLLFSVMSEANLMRFH